MTSYRRKLAKPAPKKPSRRTAAGKGAPGAQKATPAKAKMAARRQSAAGKARNIEKYEHPEKKRLNNPPVGLVTPETDPDEPKKTYAYDPHLDPQLVWAGKAEKSVLELDTVSLHVHERIDPHTIMEAVRTKESFVEQPSLFEQASENPPLREALDFYKHQHGWSNRLIAGDSALVMNSLLEKEGMAGQVQMVYVDPPYGIKYRSNFQPFVNQRDVEDNDKDLTQEPEMVRAFRDTWELGIHSYLSYLRDRLILAHRLLSNEGSIFVQISDENIHLVRAVCDEVFKAENFVCIINFVTANAQTGKLLENNTNYIVWYARNKATAKSRPLLLPKARLRGGMVNYRFLEMPDGTRRPMDRAEMEGTKAIPQGARIFRADKLMSSHPPGDFPVHFDGKTWRPKKGYWSTGEAGMENLKKARRLMGIGETLCYVRYIDDFPAYPIGSQWNDTMQSGFGTDKIYVVQTNPKVIQRCMLMTTDPGDLVLDPTCGSGTTAIVAERWGRRWITCDTSRVALTLAKQRLMLASYDYYELANPSDGVDSGFVYENIKHVTLKSVANNEPEPTEPLYDRPIPEPAKARVTGPFTVEAVPAPMSAAFEPNNKGGDETVARSGATARERDWRGELLKTGVRAHGGKVLKFSRVEPLYGTSFLHAEAETIEEKPQRVVISFGADFAPLEQRQVEGAWHEARELDPKPSIVLFAAFQFDPEAAKDIDEMPEAVTKRTTFLKVQMNTDLLTGDLKKKRSANESFWLIGRPDVELRKIANDSHVSSYEVEVHGFDYYDVKSGEIVSGDASKIAMWMLDPDYDDRSLYPRQVFFPMAGEKDGWSKLAKNLKAEIDEDLIEAYHGTVSIPFTLGANKRIAVKIIDDRGVESMRVISVS